MKERFARRIALSAALGSGAIGSLLVVHGEPPAPEHHVVIRVRPEKPSTAARSAKKLQM